MEPEEEPSIIDQFRMIEELASFWKGLEQQKNWCQSTPQLLPIIQGAIDRTRLEIILLCKATIT